MSRRIARLIRSQSSSFFLVLLLLSVLIATRALTQRENQTIEIQQLQLIRESVLGDVKNEQMLASYIGGNVPNAITQGNYPISMQAGNYPNQVVNGNLPNRLVTGNSPLVPTSVHMSQIDLPQPQLITPDETQEPVLPEVRRETPKVAGLSH